MTTPRAVWGTFKHSGKYWLCSKKFIISGQTDTHGQEAELLTQQHQLSTSTCLVVTLENSHSFFPHFVHPSCLDWKMFSCDCVHVFVLESLSVQSLSVFLGECFCPFGKKKMKNTICHSILSNACIGKKSNVFSWPKKKTRKCRFGVFCKSCQSLEFSGESTVEISETSYFFFPENKFEPKNQVALWVRNRWNPFFLWFVLQLLFISSCLVLPAYWNILRAPDALQTFPAKSLAVPAAFALQGRGSKGRGWTDWPVLSKCQLVTGLLHPKIGREQEV